MWWECGSIDTGVVIGVVIARTRATARNSYDPKSECRMEISRSGMVLQWLEVDSWCRARSVASRGWIWGLVDVNGDRMMIVEGRATLHEEKRCE